MKFAELNLSKDILDALEALKFEQASPIQAQAIPHLLEGHDLIGQAQTGTGKTAAFGIPVIERLDPNIRDPQVLVLCPTRELACQIADQFKKIARFKRQVSIVSLYGGQQIDIQFKALRRGANVIVATPGRLMDHINRRSVNMDSIKTVVLDEVDEMLNVGFKQAIDEIFERIPNRERQTILFSATVSERIMGMAMRYQKNPKLVKIAQTESSSANIEQFYYEIKERAKPEALTNLINEYKLKFSLVFCNTKRQVDEVVRNLNDKGYFANGLHGDMRQSQRDRVMNSFRRGETEILVATDVAARGIDMNIEAVFNYDVPEAAESYLHRIGRTGRAGQTGKAFTFVVGSQIHKLNTIKRYSKGQIHNSKLPV